MPVSTKWDRWFRNEPIDPPAGGRRSTLAAVSADDPSVVHPRTQTFGITSSIGGFSHVGIAWEGTSVEDAYASFLEFLNNDEKFGLEHWPKYRKLNVRFHGQSRVIIFRRDWVAGFTIG